MNIDKIITNIEKAMVQLPESAKPKDGEVCGYLAGYVDSLCDAGVINEKTREILYLTYAEHHRTLDDLLR